MTGDQLFLTGTAHPRVRRAVVRDSPDGAEHRPLNFDASWEAPSIREPPRFAARSSLKLRSYAAFTSVTA